MITQQPLYDSLYSAYSQIPVETHVDTPGLEVKTQDFDKASMISLNIINSEPTTVLDNRGGSEQWSNRHFQVYREMVAGEWYTFRVSRGFSGETTRISVAFYQGNEEGRIIETAREAYGVVDLGTSMTWSFQIRKDLKRPGPTSVLIVYAGPAGGTAGKMVTLQGMTLAYGQIPVSYRPSTKKAVDLLTESTYIHRDSGFGGRRSMTSDF